jgi:iron complex outermembrane receptor protein
VEQRAEGFDVARVGDMYKLREKVILLLSGAAAAVVLSPIDALAQQSGAVVELEQIVVEGEAQGQAGEETATGPVKGYVARRTATGSKTDTPVEEIPQSVSVVGREEIDDRGAQKTDEALRYTAGVFAQPFGPDSDTNWLFIRGFQATATGVYMDGLQLYSHAFGGFFIDSFGLERIEVLKGPASVLYGGSNPGGMVNYVSKRPTGEKLRSAETGINDAGNVYLGFDVGDMASDVVDYRVLGRIAGGNGYSDFQEDFRGFVAPSLTWKPDEQTSFTLLANYTHLDQIHGGGGFLPYVGTVVDAPFGRIPREANYTEPSLDSYDREQASIGYEFEHTFDNDWTVRQNARYGRADVSEVSLYPNGYNALDPNALDRINFSHDTKVATFLLDNQIEGKVETGPIEHRILAGIDYKYYNIDQVQSSALFATTPPIDVLDPVYGVPQADRVSYLNQDLVQKQLGLYVQDQLRFAEGWLVTLNGRYDQVWTDAHDRPTFYAPTQDETVEGTDGEFSGRAGIAYEFDNGLIPYASVATFFNPQIGTTGAGELFVPETGTQYEIGLKYVPTFFDGSLTASVFDLTRQNVLTDDPTNIFAQIQTGEVRSRGVEFEAKADITEDFKITAAFTAYDLQITKDTDPTVIGKTPVIVPEVQASLSADYTFRGDMLDGVTIGGGVRYIGSSWADNQNTLKVRSVTLVDAKLGYEKDNWGVDLNVTNLFDKAYVASCQTPLGCSYGEGRSVKLKAHVTW